MTACKLVKPSEDYKESYLEALGEYHEEGRFLYQNIQDLTENFERFVHHINADKGYPGKPRQDWVEVVPETILWLVKENTYIGTVDIRHRLNWHLEKWGGHLNVLIRPSMRQQGYGKKAFEKSIPYIDYLGIDCALITVDPDNKSACGLVESVGGTLENETQATDQFPKRKRYWLNCN